MRQMIAYRSGTVCGKVTKADFAIIVGLRRQRCSRSPKKSAFLQVYVCGFF
jgi:hypothetical protein